MKYNAEAHLEDINSDLTALMLDLGLNPQNIDNISFIDLKEAIKTTYFMDSYPDPNDPNVENNPNLEIRFQRAKSILNARKLTYIRKIVSERV